MSILQVLKNSYKNPYIYSLRKIWAVNIFALKNPFRKNYDAYRGLKYPLGIWHMHAHTELGTSCSSYKNNYITKL